MGIRILGLEKGAYLQIKSRLSPECFSNVEVGAMSDVYDVELSKATSLFVRNDEIYLSYGYKISPLSKYDFIEVRIQ